MGTTSAKVPQGPAPRLYRATQGVGARLWIWLPVVGGGGAAVLGTVYAVLCYLAFMMEKRLWLIMVTPMFAAALVPLAQWVCRLGNVRRRRLRLPIALCVGAMGLYAAWYAYLNIGFHEWSETPIWAMTPLRMWHAMVAMAGDSEERGVGSWFLWAFEAVTVFGCILFMVMLGGEDREVPYCEKCGQWCKEILSIPLGETNDDVAAEGFRQGHMEMLRKLGPRKRGASSYMQVRAFECPCLASRYACLERVTITRGNKGGLKFRQYGNSRNSRLSYRLPSGDTEDVVTVVANIEIDAGMEKALQTLGGDRK